MITKSNLQNMQYENNMYYEVKSDGKKDGPYCSACWDKDSKAIRMHLSGRNTYECPVCKSTAEVKEKPVPHKPFDLEEFMAKFFKSMLYALPTSIIGGLVVSGQYIYLNYPGYSYDYLQDSQLLAIYVLPILIFIVLLAIPMAIALYNNKKYKGWIIAFAVLSFPLGFLYPISLIWSILAPRETEKPHTN